MTGATGAMTGAMTGATGVMTGKTVGVAGLGCSGNRELGDRRSRIIVRCTSSSAYIGSGGFLIGVRTQAF